MRPLTLAIAVLLASGCGTATIYLKDGTSFEARIKRGDESSIHVLPVKKCYRPSSKKRSRAAPRKGQDHKKTRKTAERKKYGTKKTCFDEERAIARSDIRDIDHPGNESAAVGGLLGGLGLVFTFSMLEGRKNCTEACFETGMVIGYFFLPAVIVAVLGSIVGIGGYVSWLRSWNAAKVPEAPKGPNITPVAMNDGEQTYYGLGMTWRW